MSAVRDVLLKRVQSRLYAYLKSQELFKDFKSGDLWKLSIEIVENNSLQIDKFLNERKYGLGETNKAVNDVLNEILIPEIGKMRI